jgi:predicted transcriptional regulator
MPKEGPDREALELASWILSSRHRTHVFVALAESPRTPKSLKDQHGAHFSTTSKALRQLRSKGLIEATSQRTKLYFLTSQGQGLLPTLKGILEKERKGESPG